MKQLYIHRCSHPMYWYAKLVGQYVPFTKDAGNGEYQSREPDGYINFVQHQDASRPSVSAPTQKEAFERTRDLAKKAESEISIHRGDNGKIRDKHSYGNDPKGTKG